MNSRPWVPLVVPWAPRNALKQWKIYLLFSDLTEEKKKWRWSKISKGFWTHYNLFSFPIFAPDGTHLTVKTQAGKKRQSESRFTALLLLLQPGPEVNTAGRSGQPLFWTALVSWLLCRTGGDTVLHLFYRSNLIAHLTFFFLFVCGD